MSSSVVEWQSEYEHGRPLSYFEKLFALLHKNQMWILARTLIFECTEKPSMEQINEALKVIMSVNPSLRMSIDRTGSIWHFVEDKTAKPRLACDYNQSDWQYVMENEMLLPMEDLKAPQFRCTYLPNVKYTDVENTDGQSKNVVGFVFTFMHAIIDGMSILGVLKQFVHALNCIVMGRDPEIKTFAKMFPPADYYMDKALEALANEEGGLKRQEEIKTTPKYGVGVFFSSQIKNIYVETKGVASSQDPSIPVRMRVITKEFTREQTERLRLACRSHGATVQGAAQIAGVIAVAELMQSSSEWQTFKLDYNFAINLRPRVAQEVPVDYSGLYMSVLTLTKEIEKESTTSTEVFWKYAAESTSGIRKLVADKRYLDSYYKVFHGEPDADVDFDINDHPSTTEYRLPRVLFTTSYGPWEFPVQDGDAIKTKALFTNSSIHKCGPLFSQQLISVNGKLSWTIGYSQRVVTQETANRFADTMFTLIENAMK